MSVFINDFNVITKVPEKQGQNLQNFPWPFCIGNKHKKPPRVFVLSLTILSPPPPPYSFFLGGGGHAMPATCGRRGRAGWPRTEKILVWSTRL